MKAIEVTDLKKKFHDIINTDIECKIFYILRGEIMNQLILECHSFFKDFKNTYAVCGGYAFEMFTNEKNRSHSDIDITLFTEDITNIVEYMLNKGWNVYEPLHMTNSLRLIASSDIERVLNCQNIWAIKPSCTFINIEPKLPGDNLFQYEILNEEQLHFDFIDIIFNVRQDGTFVCDENNNINRNLDKAILHQGGIPYLAPEIILFFISNPAYLESDYHREKNNTDWKSIPPSLQKESLNWLIDAIRTAYPEGNRRLDELLALNQ